MSPHHRRRYADPPDGALGRFLWHAERVWQDVIPLIALILAAVAVFGQESDSDRQREGRAVAIDVLCGSMSGVQKAGELILKDKLPGTEKYRGGEPSSKERERRNVYARSYVDVISGEVVRVAGVEGKDVLDPDGSVNCKRLKEAARAVPDGQ